MSAVLNSMNPIDWACSHSDIFEGVRVNCNAQPGILCRFVDAMGVQRPRNDFHSERLDAAREMTIRDGSEPSVEEFMKALESDNRLGGL